MNYKVSIIIPVYNVEKYLRQCLDSVVHQTLKEIEIIAVNDGSPDNCPKILDEYAAKDSRFKVIHKQNTGYGHSMNMGIDAAQGEYVGIVESDDYVLSNMFKDLYALATVNDADLVKSDFYRFYIDDHGKEVRKLDPLAPEDSYYGRVIDPCAEPEVLPFKMNTWCGIYKRSFLNQYGIRHNETPGASFQDNGFWFQTFYFARRVYFSNRAYYMNRRDNPNSSVASTGKVYAMCDEYGFIEGVMERFPEKRSIFLPYVMLKKFHNYELTYNRIDDAYKPEFVERFRSEIQRADEAGDLQEDVFTDVEWRRVKLLQESVQQYLCQEKVDRAMLHVNSLREQLEAITGSVSFKVGRRITAPLRYLRDLKARLLK